MIGRTNTGGGNGIHLNIRNYAVLPSTGRRNDIALINDTPINHVYVQSSIPSSPEEGDIFLRTGWGSNVYFWFKPVAVNITTCKQYLRTGGTDEEPTYAWTIIPEWYMYMSDGWKRSRLYLIQNGTSTGIQTLTTRRWSIGGLDGTGGSGTDAVLNFTQGASYATLSYQGSTSTNGTYGAGGICTPNFNAGQYSKICLDAYVNVQPGYLSVNEYSDGNASTSPYAYSTISSNSSRRTTEVTITQTDTPCCVFFGLQATRNNGWVTANCRIYNLYLE